MKHITLFFTIICFTVINVFAQVDPNRSLINQRVLSQRVNFNVIENSRDSLRRTATVNSFNLRPTELKASAKIGDKIEKIDITNVSILKDTLKMDRVQMLPELYIAKESATGNELKYIIIFVDATPLQYESSNNDFRGMIRFLPIESNYVNQQLSIKYLAVPDTIYLSYNQISLPIVISQINYPPIDMSITASNPLDSLSVKIFTVLNPFGYPTYLPVEPAIVLSSNRHTIQGLGVQTMPFYLSLKGVTSYKPIPVALISSFGDIDSSRVTLKDNSPVKAILRSESLGKIDIAVTQNHYPSNSLSVNAVFPWLFFVLSIIGGLIGGVGKNLIDKKKVTIGLIIGSSIVGLIAAVVYLGLGINLLQITDLHP